MRSSQASAAVVQGKMMVWRDDEMVAFIQLKTNLSVFVQREYSGEGLEELDGAGGGKKVEEMTWERS